MLVQLSDPHIGATWTAEDPVDGLAAAVAAVRRLELRPDALLLSGDLAEHAADAEYERVRELIAPLAAPAYPVAGNHDDRAALRRHFRVPGRGGEPLQYAAQAGPLRLVVLDSTVPGEARGELDSARLEWLDAELRAAPDAPTLLALHHPPLVAGLPAMDALGLAAADRAALATMLERHPQVRGIAAGHMHRTIAGELAGRPVLAAPSTYAESRLDFRSDRLRFTDAPGAFAVHALVDGRLSSHVQAVPLIH